MDFPNADFLVEFLEVAIHNIVYLSRVYPSEIFENRKKYNVPLKICTHPEVNSHIAGFLKTLRATFTVGAVHKIVLLFKDECEFELQRFCFELSGAKSETGLSNDEYYIRCEQSMRAFCFKLLNSRDSVKRVPVDSTFQLLLFTTEATALQIQSDAGLEDFPMIYFEDKLNNDKAITPMDDIHIDKLAVHMYAMHSEHFL